MTGPSTPEGGSSVRALERGLAVIRSFDARHRQRTLTEIAAATGLGEPTAGRLVHTLTALGYLRSDGGHYVLTSRVLTLGYSGVCDVTLPQIAQPYLEELAAQAGRSCSVAVLDGTDVVYVARASRRRIMTVAIDVGTRLPAWVTSLGRVLLAAQPDAMVDECIAATELVRHTDRTVRDRGELRRILRAVRVAAYASVDRELEPVLRSIAVPIRNRAGVVVAAMNISADVEASLDSHLALLPMLRDTVTKVERDLHALGGPARIGTFLCRQRVCPDNSIDVEQAQH